MTYTTKGKHILYCANHRYMFDKLSFSGGTQIVSTPTVDSEIYRNIQGAKPFEIHIDGAFAPSEGSFFAQLIRDISNQTMDIIIDSQTYSGVVLKSGSTKTFSDRFLGEVSLVFEVI